MLGHVFAKNNPAIIKLVLDSINDSFIQALQFTSPHLYILGRTTRRWNTLDQFAMIRTGYGVTFADKPFTVQRFVDGYAFLLTPCLK